MANANGHEIGCTCEACFLAAAHGPLPTPREIAPGITASPGAKGAPCFLLVHCGGFISTKKIRCKATLEVPLPVDELAELLLDAGWIGSAVTPIGAPKNVLMPLCGACARIIHGDALVAAAFRTRRQKPGTA